MAHLQMVYLSKMVIFHGELLNNQMVIYLSSLILGPDSDAESLLFSERFVVDYHLRGGHFLRHHEPLLRNHRFDLVGCEDRGGCEAEKEVGGYLDAFSRSWENAMEIGENAMEIGSSAKE